MRQTLFLAREVSARENYPPRRRAKCNFLVYRAAVTPAADNKRDAHPSGARPRPPVESGAITTCRIAPTPFRENLSPVGSRRCSVAVACCNLPFAIVNNFVGSVPGPPTSTYLTRGNGQACWATGEFREAMV